MKTTPVTLGFKNEDCGSEVTVVIERVEKYSSREGSNGTPTNNTLYRPMEKNKKGLDAIIIESQGEGWIIQITFNSKHAAMKVDAAYKDFLLLWIGKCAVFTLQIFRVLNTPQLHLNVRMMIFQGRSTLSVW